MNPYITPTDIRFDPKKLRSNLEYLSKNHEHPISLRTVAGDVDDPYSYGSRSLYDSKGGIAWESDSNWVRYIPQIEKLYVVDVVKQIEMYAAEHLSCKVGRARLLSLNPKECYTYHRDIDNILRIHVPVITNDKCLFINDDIVGRMPEAGRMYLFNTLVMHTALNASRERRTHLVVNCYKY